MYNQENYLFVYRDTDDITFWRGSCISFSLMPETLIPTWTNTHWEFYCILVNELSPNKLRYEINRVEVINHYGSIWAPHDLIMHVTDTVHIFSKTYSVNQSTFEHIQVTFVKGTSHLIRVFKSTPKLYLNPLRSFW